MDLVIKIVSWLFCPGPFGHEQTKMFTSNPSPPNITEQNRQTAQLLGSLYSPLKQAAEQNRFYPRSIAKFFCRPSLCNPRSRFRRLKGPCWRLPSKTENSYHFFWANQKVISKFFSWTQYEFCVNRCYWRTLAGNEKKMGQDCLNRTGPSRGDKEKHMQFRDNRPWVWHQEQVLASPAGEPVAPWKRTMFLFPQHNM